MRVHELQCRLRRVPDSSRFELSETLTTERDYLSVCPGPGGRGLSLFGSFARAGGLGPNEDNPLAGTWQVAFLGEIEPRAADPPAASSP